MLRIFYVLIVVLSPSWLRAQTICPVVENLSHAIDLHVSMASGQNQDADIDSFLRSPQSRMTSADLRAALSDQVSIDQLGPLLRFSELAMMTQFDLRTGNTQRAIDRIKISKSLLDQTQTTLTPLKEQCNIVTDVTPVVKESSEQVSPFAAATGALLGFVALCVGVSFAGRLSKRKSKRAQRHPCHIETEFHLGDEKYFATLLDISREGGKIRFDGPTPPMGAEFPLTFENHQTTARCMWSKPPFCGVLFARPLTDADLNSLLRKK